MTFSSLAEEADSEYCRTAEDNQGLYCPQTEQITIFGSATDVKDVTGGATLLSEDDLTKFEATDVVRAMRSVPGVSFQVEDGYGLRPNISIRGTATERSSRVTLMEDGVLIAPATYTAPSAYYFPTFGRINQVEVLKGPAAITQGPYTVGGAINLISTPIPEANAGKLQAEVGSDSTWRIHGWYGGGTEQAAFLVETHQWQSDGYQTIDRSDNDTGLDKQDYLAKFRFKTDQAASVRHEFNIKLQSSDETSEQSYLGLTDKDFSLDASRRYGLSAEDVMNNDHEQVVASWLMEWGEDSSFSVTAYDNEFSRAWYKTEGIDFDGSDNAQDFSRTSWANVIRAVNLGNELDGLDPVQLQAVLDGADTAAGSIQVRNNSRDYASRGVQMRYDRSLETSAALHSIQVGLRLHEDEEDRLQRNDTYQQISGNLVLSDRGLEGNAGNRVQDAEAWAVYVQDRIEWDQWTFSPGLRYESIDLSRTDYNTGSADPSSRDPDNFRSNRENSVDVWIPGMGLLYDIDESVRLVGGVHKGFAVPGNQPGVNPEESVNYEFGVRYFGDNLQLDVIGFYNDYDNLVGICTNSSGSDCEPGDAFNGNGASVPGIEVSLSAELAKAGDWQFPVNLTYSWMQAEFDSSFDSDFFGDVSKGDPVPYIPDHQALLTLGMVKAQFSAYLSANYVDSVCTQASCGAFEKTGSATLIDLAVHYQLNPHWGLYGNLENLSDETYVAGREPYGARGNKPRSFNVGVRLDF